MFEANLAAQGRNADLPAVQMPRQNEVESAGPKVAYDVRKMEEQDAEIGFGVRKIAEEPPVGPQALIAAHDLHRLSAHRQQHGIVLEQDGSRVLDHRGIRGLREGVAGHLDVVVAEDRKDAQAWLERGDRRLQPGLAALSREKVARDRDDVTGRLRGPAHRTLQRAAVEGDRAEVEVR